LGAKGNQGLKKSFKGMIPKEAPPGKIRTKKERSRKGVHQREDLVQLLPGEYQEAGKRRGEGIRKEKWQSGRERDSITIMELKVSLVLKDEKKDNDLFP